MANYNINLSTRDITALQNALIGYGNSFQMRMQRAINELLDIGIITAQSNTGAFAGKISFSKSVIPGYTTCSGILIAVDQVVIQEWYAMNPKLVPNAEPRREEIRPLLLAEFGSGFLADTSMHESAVGLGGQGTMPNSYGHASDPDGWYWYDKDGVLHHSIGEKPSYPIYKAYISMVTSINNAFYRAFIFGAS